MSDWELGRQKWLLYCQEMRHTKEDPTWMRTSKEVYQWLDSTARHSKRTFQQKQGAGVFLRVYHWAENTEIPPLASLAEIKTLKDTAGNAVTQMGHLWIDVNNPGYIKTREYACLTCPQCIRLKFGKCTLGFARVNTLRTCQIKYENSGLLITERETGNRGRERALACALGDLIGAECADDMEPYIVCRVTGTLSIWQGAAASSWMGEIKANDEYFTCLKFQKQSELKYVATKEAFYLLATDVRVRVRVRFENHKEVKGAVCGRSTRTRPATTPATFELNQRELDTLKLRVYITARDGGL